MLADVELLDKVSHYITIFVNLGVFTLVAASFKKFLELYRFQLRVGERLDQVWRVFCVEHDIEYVSLKEE